MRVHVKSYIRRGKRVKSYTRIVRASQRKRSKKSRR